MIPEFEVDKVRESGAYPAYTPNFEPLYYVTTYGLVLCATCAETNAKFGRDPESVLYIKHMRISENEFVYCSNCHIRIERKIELEYARQMADMIEKQVQGNW